MPVGRGIYRNPRTILEFQRIHSVTDVFIHSVIFRYGNGSSPSCPKGLLTGPMMLSSFDMVAVSNRMK